MSELKPWRRLRRRLGALTRASGLTGGGSSKDPKGDSQGVKPTPEKQSPTEQPAAPTQDQAAALRLAELSDAGAHEEALTLAEAEFERIRVQDRPARDLLRQIQASAALGGAISLHVAVLRHRLEREPKNKLVLRQLRRQEGRWYESEPGWLPTIEPGVLAQLPQRLAERKRNGKILHLLKVGMPHRQSGYSMRSMYTLIGQVRAGLHPVAVTALDFPRNIGVEDAASEDDVGGVRYLHLLRDTIPDHEPWDDYLCAYATALAPVVAAQDPDLIHVHSGNRGTEAALVALAVGRALGLPVVYEVRGFFESLWTKDTHWAERAELYHRRREAEAWCLREADLVVTLSESMKDDIIARGIEPDHVHVVPNGLDPNAFVPRGRDVALAAELGLTDRFVFGYVSNLDHYREGQELLIDAALELRRRGVPATALIVGDGARREFLEQRAEASGAGDAVLFTGRIPHDVVGAYYAQLDVFVIPRINERAARLVTPLKPYEAMAMQIPLVVSDLPALLEITGNGDRGEVFATGDATSLAEVLERLASDSERREQLAARAREWVLGHRTWAHNDELYAHVYNAVLGRRLPQPRK